MNKCLSLLQLMDYVRPTTSNSRALVEGEEVFHAGHIIMCGKGKITPKSMEIYSLCLQSSTVSSEPHQISGALALEKGMVKIVKMVCSCKAGAGGRCKHITAVLIKLTREPLSVLEEVSCTDLKCIWASRKSSVKDKYRAVSMFYMPCFEGKFPQYPSNVDEEYLFKYCVESLPNCGIGIHNGYGRNINIVQEDCKDKSASNNILQNILDNCAQSIVLMEITSEDVGASLVCCKNILQHLFSEDIDAAMQCIQNSNDWHNFRRYRITGSRCYEIFTYSGVDWNNKASRYFWPKSFSNKYVLHGLKFEDYAITAFQVRTKSTIQKCGTIIPHNNRWLAYSPDGIVMDENQKPSALLEVKCLYEGASKSISEVLSSCKFIYKKNGQYELKKKHKYYGQIQMGMAVLNVHKCFLVLYASFDDSVEIMEIKFDYSFAKNMLQKIKHNFHKNMIHVLCENNII